MSNYKTTNAGQRPEPFSDMLADLDFSSRTDINSQWPNFTCTSRKNASTRDICSPEFCDYTPDSESTDDIVIGSGPTFNDEILVASELHTSHALGSMIVQARGLQMPPVERDDDSARLRPAMILREGPMCRRPDIKEDNYRRHSLRASIHYDADVFKESIETDDFQSVARFSFESCCSVDRNRMPLARSLSYKSSGKSKHAQCRVTGKRRPWDPTPSPPTAQTTTKTVPSEQKIPTSAEPAWSRRVQKRSAGNHHWLDQYDE